MRQITVFVFILALAWLQPAVAGERSQPLAHVSQPPLHKEAGKAQRIKAILQKHLMYPQTSVNDSAFCGPFFEALKNASPKIEYVEPVLKTDDPNHPGLKHYHRCDGATYPGGPPDNAFDTFDAIGHKNFKLYHADLDNNPKNAVEEVIYAEMNWDRSHDAQQPGYSIINLEQCTFTGDGMPIHQSDRPEGGVLDSYNALIRYQKRYYVVDLYNVGGEPLNPAAYSLMVWNFQENIKQQKDRIPCAWSWRKDSLSKESQER